MKTTEKFIELLSHIGALNASPATSGSGHFLQIIQVVSSVSI
jgi:hypothetical protein